MNDIPQHKEFYKNSNSLLITLSIFLIVFIALFFRLPLYQYIMAGQDEGTYLNIGHQYFKQHSLSYKDYFRAGLTTDQKALYDKYINYLMPSIEFLNMKNSTFSMDFYPMHSIWLAIFEAIFGQNNAVYSLTFFSLISITALSLLAYEISGKNKPSALVVAILFAVNPLHAFFSKFPVGEITAVAFTSLGFYFLVQYITNIKTHTNKSILLAFSLLSFTCFFYTRMSSVIYIPVIFFFSILTTLYIQEPKAKRNLLIYFGLWVVSFCVSYLFYYFFQPSLFHLIYGSTIKNLLPHSSDLIIGTLLLLGASVIYLIYKIHNQKIIDRIKQTITNAFPIIFFALIIAVVCLTYVSFLNIDLKIFSPLDAFERYWYIGVNAFQKLKYLNFYVIMEYLTPVGFVLCFVAGSHYLKNFQKNILKIALFTFVMWYLLVNVSFGDLMRYPYYNTRYLFSESVVYMLLLVGVYLGKLIQNKKTKILGVTCLLLIAACSLPFSLFQLNGPEGPHLDFYNNITSIVHKDDLILTSTGHSTDKPQKYFDNFTTWTIAPLKFYYDLNVFILPTFEDAYSQPIKDLSAKYKNTYLISDKEMSNLGFNLILSRPTYSYYNVSETCSLHTYSYLPLESVKTMKIPKFLECLTPPNNYYTRYSNLYMYNITAGLK